MLILFSRACFFALPFILAGLIHIAVIKFGFLKSLESIPLDGGATINGQPVFGKNKTLRGAATVIISIAVFFILERIAARHFLIAAKLNVINIALIPSIGWSVLLGVGCIVGELPNSFLKRRLNIAPGAKGEGGFLRTFFWVMDQIDSLLGVLVLASFHWRPSWGMLIALFVIAMVIHPIGGALMVGLGLKRSV